ncbi:unnamed protein product [Blepharisma stoltei]|uniref:Uncharacterized protein n=1 Tax=Blepharisma stoltei TaxID=1481888 RepID=A0AAU9K5F1_9CILI|nr:unnamed protein product [Blepharisma stoltei]
MSDLEEDSITWTMAEYGQFQNELLNLKHENQKLKSNSERYEELIKLAPNPYFEIINLRKALDEKSKPKDDPSKLKFPLFSRQIALECLKKVRKEELLTDDQELLLEQLLAIFEHMWPKGGQADTARPNESTIEDISSKAEQKRVSDLNGKLKLSLEVLEEKCKAIEIALDSTVKENNDLRIKNSQLENQKETLIIDLANREEEVSDARQALKEKYAIECSREELDLENSKLKRNLEKLEQEIKELRGNGAITLKEEIKGLIKENQELKKSFDELKGNEHLLQIEYNNLKNSARDNMQELGNISFKNKELENRIKNLEEINKKLQSDYEDAKTEKQIVQKRSMHDLKDLKNQYSKEKSMHEQCKLEKERLLQELKGAQGRSPKTSNEPMSFQEKIIVEALSHRVQELEQELIENQNKAADYDEMARNFENLQKENEDLKAEINKLQTDIGMLGAQFNEIMRNKSYA